jgi:two-component system sensor histidine kinase PilS (NtrC family)
MQKKENLQRRSWFIPLRLASFVILFSVVVFWMHYPRFLHLWFVLYSVFTLAFTLLLAVDRTSKLKRITAGVIAFQFVFEIVLESGIIYATGNVNSPFSALFILTIVSAALAYRLAGTLVVASLVSLAYTFIIWLGLSSTVVTDFSLQALKTIFSAPDSVFYAIFLHVLIFYLVAFISGYLAERLRDQVRQLANTSQALRRARLETDDILRHLNSGLLTIDALGRIIFFNRAAERILGYREEEVRGMHCREVFAGRMPYLAECLMDGIRYGMAHPRKEIEIVSADSAAIPLGLSTSVLTEEHHTLRGVIAIFSDLTEAKRLEAKVRAADRLAAIGELSASIAHEIRNPLAAISGSVEVLKKELEVSQENAQLMALIVKESDRLSRILSEFLQYARIDRPAYTKVELCHLINEVVQLLYHHQSFSENVRIHFETDESIVYVIGNDDLIKQLLLNLAVNACQSFEGESGTLTFRLDTESTSGNVRLCVQDNGPGITEESLKKIFEPFYSTKKQGTGLGLSIVHRICSALKLDLKVESQVGHGTTFVIEFKKYQFGTSDVQRSCSPQNTRSAASV